VSLLPVFVHPHQFGHQVQLRQVPAFAIGLPGPASIARYLIHTWLTTELD
jgi:hypothetical protein